MKQLDIFDYRYFLNDYKIWGHIIYKKYSSYIIYYSDRYNIDSEILFAIIVAEQSNRGDILTRILEKIAAIYVNFYKLDPSLGLAQIKVSTAQSVIKHPVRNIAWKLTTASFNIDCLSRIIKEKSCQIGCDKREIGAFISWYTTGKKGNEKIPSLQIYISLVEWSLETNFFKRLRREMGE